MNCSKHFFIYAFYQITKSTALVTPVLYLIFQSNLGVSMSSIIQIAAIYTFLNFFLEVPLGIFSDSRGPILSIKLGITSLALSFSSIIFVQSFIGVHLLFLFSAIAANCFSGADQALLRMMLGDNDIEMYRDYSYKVSSNMYLFTAPFLILGVLLYSAYDYRVLLTLQIFSLLICLCVVRAYEKSEKYNPKKLTFRDQFLSVKKGLSLGIRNKKFLSLILINTAFALAVTINHKTIQQQIKVSFTDDFLFWLTCAFAIGNVISWASSQIFRKIFAHTNSTVIPLLILFTMFLLIYIGFWHGGAIIIFISYLGICAFKSAYRPLIGSEIVKNIWNKGDTASFFSVMAILIAIISAFSQWILAPFYENMSYGNLATLIFVSILSLIGILIYNLSSRQVLFYSHSNLSQKTSKVILFKDEYLFKQEYQIDLDKLFYEKFYRLLPLTHYKHPELKEISYKDQFIVWEAIRGNDLEKRKITSTDILTFFLASQNSNNIIQTEILPKACIPNLESFLNELPEECKNRLLEDSYQGVIHGDLHPGNVMQSNGRLLAIDWDLCGVGPKWFDYLTLVVHPWTYLDDNERIRIIHTLLSLTKEESYHISKSFAKFKIIQLESFATEHNGFADLVNGYRQLLNRLS